MIQDLINNSHSLTVIHDSMSQILRDSGIASLDASTIYGASFILSMVEDGKAGDNSSEDQLRQRSEEYANKILNHLQSTNNQQILENMPMSEIWVYLATIAVQKEQKIELTKCLIDMTKDRISKELDELPTDNDELAQETLAPIEEELFKQIELLYTEYSDIMPLHTLFSTLCGKIGALVGGIFADLKKQKDNADRKKIQQILHIHLNQLKQILQNKLQSLKGQNKNISVTDLIASKLENLRLTMLARRSEISPLKGMLYGAFLSVLGGMFMSNPFLLPILAVVGKEIGKNIQRGFLEDKLLAEELTMNRRIIKEVINAVNVEHSRTITTEIEQAVPKIQEEKKQVPKLEEKYTTSEEFLNQLTQSGDIKIRTDKGQSIMDCTKEAAYTLMGFFTASGNTNAANIFKNNLAKGNYSIPLDGDMLKVVAAAAIVTSSAAYAAQTSSITPDSTPRVGGNRNVGPSRT
jgi:hypothetical protein